MEGVSIFNSVTLIRGVQPDAIMDINAVFRKRDGYSGFQYSKRLVPNLWQGLKYLAPLVFAPRNRYLFCFGTNGTLSVYSNGAFGGAADLTRPSAARLNIDVMDAYWNDYERARQLDPVTIRSDPRFHFNLDVRLKTQNDRRRTIGCTVRSNGDIYDCWDGELFPFENPADYTHLPDGAHPGMHILDGFCGLFGWPPATSPDYPDFITSCILYEFPASPQYPERPVSKALQEEALRWPWERPKRIFNVF